MSGADLFSCLLYCSHSGSSFLTLSPCVTIYGMISQPENRCSEVHVWSPSRHRRDPSENVSRPTSYICRTYRRGPARSRRQQGLSAEVDEATDREGHDEDEEMAADEQEQSIEELLSGPKDSVMMFAGRQESSNVSPSRFQLASAGVFDE